MREDKQLLKLVEDVVSKPVVSYDENSYGEPSYTTLNAYRTNLPTGVRHKGDWDQWHKDAAEYLSALPSDTQVRGGFWGNQHLGTVADRLKHHLSAAQ